MTTLRPLAIFLLGIGTFCVLNSTLKLFVSYTKLSPLSSQHEVNIVIWDFVDSQDVDVELNDSYIVDDITRDNVHTVSGKKFCVCVLAEKVQLIPSTLRYKELKGTPFLRQKPSAA